MAVTTGEDNFGDLVNQEDISEAAILAELQSRFRKDVIYSSIGPIIIALNPYKQIPGLYSSEKLNGLLHEQSDGNYATSSHGCHVWLVAQAAYQQLHANLQPQAIVISGESGGKFNITGYSCLRSWVD